jgi:hypothetical protein
MTGRAKKKKKKMETKKCPNKKNQINIGAQNFDILRSAVGLHS